MEQIKNNKFKDLKISKDLFINISNEIFNFVKCKKCDFVPLFPIVLKRSDLEKNNDNEILCRDCFIKLNSDKNFSIKINNIDKQYSSHLKSKIEKKEIKCINKNLGCKWQGEICHLESHLNNDCLFIEIKCPNNDCDKIILKKDLNEHLAQCDYIEKIIQLKCKFCNKIFDINDISKHFKVCSEIIIECEKGCGKKMKRKEIEEHKNNNCPEELIKCDYWEKGCKKLIKRKFLSDHYKLERNNHNRLNGKNKEEFGKNFFSIDNKILPINKDEKNLYINDEQIFQNLDFINNINDVINQKKDQNKRNNNYDYYIPFTEKVINFITQEENIKAKIFLFEYKKIKYSGNFYNNLDFQKYYILLSEESLNLKETTNFQFKIYPPFNSDSNEPFPLPWIAFGIYFLEKGEIIDFNNIYFQDINFKCFDLEGYIYTNGKKVLNKGKNDNKIMKLNINGYIIMSFKPDDNSFIIKDNHGVEIKFIIKMNKSDGIINDIRFCFIFKGGDRAIVDYNY